MPTWSLAEPGTPPSAHPCPLLGTILLSRQRDRSSERLSHLPRVTKQIFGKARTQGQVANAPKACPPVAPHPVPGASYGLQESLPGLTSGAVPNCAWGRASRRRTWQKCPSSKRIPYQAQLNAEYIFCSWQSPLLQVSLGHRAEVVELRGSLSQTLTSVESPRCAEVGTTHSREPVILS